MNGPKVQLDALTGARGIAAWMVVFYHVRAAFSEAVPQPLIDVMAKGYLAVDLFFILSGFVMWLNYCAKFERQGIKAAPDFLMRRIARIYPLHLVILVAMIAYVGLLEASGRDGSHFPWNELPLHFLLVQNWGFTPRLTWNDPAWSISTEFAAYLVLPLVAPLLLRRGWGIISCVAAIALLCAGLGAFMSWRGGPTLGHHIVDVGVIRCIAEFFMGVFLCKIWMQAGDRMLRQISFFALAVVLGFGIAWLGGLMTEMYAIPGLFVAVVFLLARSSSWQANPLISRFAVFVGDISYSTYLVHFFLWVLFKHFLDEARDVPFPVMLLYFVLTFAVSAILYKWVEQPGRGWVQSIAARLGLRRAQAAATPAA